MKYYLFSLHPDTYGKIIGPFNTQERVEAYRKKNNFFGFSFEEENKNTVEVLDFFCEDIDLER